MSDANSSAPSVVSLDPAQYAGIHSYLENQQEALLIVIGLVVLVVMLVGFLVGYMVTKK